MYDPESDLLRPLVNFLGVGTLIQLTATVLKASINEYASDQKSWAIYALAQYWSRVEHGSAAFKAQSWIDKNFVGDWLASEKNQSNVLRVPLGLLGKPLYPYPKARKTITRS